MLAIGTSLMLTYCIHSSFGKEHCSEQMHFLFVTKISNYDKGL